MKTSFGDIIKYHRTKNNWTVKQFTKLLGRDISPSYFTKIEIHENIPSPSLVILIARKLELDPISLLKVARAEKINQMTKVIKKKYTL